MGGLSIGIFWGALVSAVGLVAVSLSNPLPPRGEIDGAEVSVAGEAGDAATPAEAPEQDVPETADVEVPEPSLDVAAEVTAEAAEGGVEEEAPPPPLAETSEEPSPGTATPATEVPLPSGSEFNRPPPEPEAALPAPDAAPAAIAPQAPALSGNEIAPRFDTSPAAQPSVVADAPTQIAAASGDATAPASPALAPAPVIAGGPTALTQPETSDAPRVRTSLLPQIAAEPDVPEEEAAANEGVEDVTGEEETLAIVDPEPEIVPLPTPVFPSIGDQALSEEETATGAPDLPADIGDAPSLSRPAEDVAALPTPAFPQTSGLPQVAIPMEREAEVEEPLPEEDPAPVDLGDLPAIQAFAAPFDGAGDRPLMAVVLIDEPESQIDIETLTRFTFPVAFAVDPLHPDGAARAAAYREAGFEVVILGAMVPDGATAVDTEVALMAALADLPEAVAVIDTPEGRIQGDRPVLDAMVGALADSGHGLVAFPRGLNAAEQSASRAGVPGATVFRYLDGEDERATVITRFLSRAAFAAAQEGTVVVVGRTRPDTVTALFSWALGGRSEAVALAPLSATLLRAASE
ncbi:divergent polysaccharide deacetylase family protein [Jannaschia sp. CCS1]|uniref:divergent polysaccharide deacetylase family protein n=1 Tax=Jannaschia sp. (strain CCS1) TaxID=290400 RepID=UPI000053D8E2|nr:divergent polysaccharide deacetylase family protein [Jannaschia sp. CCS1]ABD54798.1 protein of unknown function DUF610 YibQ [Jannaschia sp. CCS1]